MKKNKRRLIIKKGSVEVRAELNKRLLLKLVRAGFFRPFFKIGFEVRIELI